MAVPAWTGDRRAAAVDWCKANLGYICGYCGHEIEDWDYSVDHILKRSDYPELTWDKANWRPMHRRKKPAWNCPGNSGLGNQQRRKRPARQVTFGPGW